MMMILNYDNQIKRRPEAAKGNVVQREPGTNSTWQNYVLLKLRFVAGEFPLTEYQHTNELLNPSELRAFVIRKHEGAFAFFFMKSKLIYFDPCSIKLHVPSHRSEYNRIQYIPILYYL